MQMAKTPKIEKFLGIQRKFSSPMTNVHLMHALNISIDNH